MDRIVEICCGSYEDALNAFNGGAKRIELNSGLALGGLTPTVSTLQLIKKHTDLEVICMIRPRGAGFSYNDLAFEQMMLEAANLLANGADGLAFGFLDDDHTLSNDQIQEMVSLIHSYKKTAVFHRAFDMVDDPCGNMEKLIFMGVDRVLTSGMQATAIEGKKLLKKLQGLYGDQIEILAGSGINEDNARALMEETGVTQIHSSCKAWRKDPTTSSSHVSFSYHENEYDYVSLEKVKALLKAVH